MTNLLNESSGNDKPVGGLAAYRAFASRKELQNEGNSDSIWGELWKTRGNFAFRIPQNSETSVIFLTDAQVFPAYELMTGWANNRNFPNKDFVRAPGWTISPKGDVSSPENCPIQTVTGLQPRIVAVGTILDMQKFTLKKGERAGTEVKYSVRPIVIKTDSVIDTLIATSDSADRDLQYAVFRVKRSNDQRSPSVGDSWFPKGYIDPEELDTKVPDWRELLAKTNVIQGYRDLNESEIKNVLNHHCRIAKKHSNPEISITQFDEAALDSYNAGGVAVASTPATEEFSMVSNNPSDVVFDDIEDDVLDLGASASDLDDIL